MKTFQRRFSSKKGKIATAAYFILAAAGIAMIVFNPTAIISYIAVVFCGLGIVYSLTEKKRMRKKVLETLKKMNPEDYNCTIFSDKIEIETIIKPMQQTAPENIGNAVIDEEAKAPAEGENPAEEEIKPIKSVFVFGQDMLDFAENDSALLLVVARRQIYCFPKRCLSEEQTGKIRDFLKEKLEG